MPIGPVGHPTEQQNILNTYVYGYTKYPNACREYLRFMWEKEQVDVWEAASGGYVAPPLPAWAGATAAAMVAAATRTIKPLVMIESPQVISADSPAVCALIEAQSCLPADE